MTQRDLEVLHQQTVALVDATQRYADALRKVQYQLAMAGTVLAESGQHCYCTSSVMCDSCLEVMVADMEQEYRAERGNY